MWDLYQVNSLKFALYMTSSVLIASFRMYELRPIPFECSALELNQGVADGPHSLIKTTFVIPMVSAIRKLHFQALSALQHQLLKVA